MRYVTAAATLCAVIAVASPARAGGAFFDWEHDGHYLVGETVRGHTTVYWNPSTGGPDDGPYRAYLVPFRRGEYDGKRALHNGIDLGVIELTQDSAKYGDAYLEFAVPDVPTGDYMIYPCNPGCRKYPGDVLGGAIRIAQSDDQAYLLARTTSLRKNLVKRLKAMESLVSRGAQSRFTRMSARLDEIEVQMGRLARRPHPVAADPASKWPPFGLGAVAGALAVLVAVRSRSGVRSGRLPSTRTT